MSCNLGWSCSVSLTESLCSILSEQKTAYKMRISDWSSDVCSSELPLTHRSVEQPAHLGPEHQQRRRHGERRHKLPRNPSPERQRDVEIPPAVQDGVRSEEHTSELQSLMRSSYAVCCLTQNKEKHHPAQHLTTARDRNSTNTN